MADKGPRRSCVIPDNTCSCTYSHCLRKVTSRTTTINPSILLVNLHGFDPNSVQVFPVRPTDFDFLADVLLLAREDGIDERLEEASGDLDAIDHFVLAPRFLLKRKKDLAQLVAQLKGPLRN